MGQVHAPAWGAEDAAAAPALPPARREKLQALCFRVRKALTRHASELEKDDSDDEEAGGEEEQRSVLFHAEGVPESLDRLRVASARFRLSLAEGVGSTSTVHRVTLDPPKLPGTLPDALRGLPRVELRFSFVVRSVAPSVRLARKSAVGLCGGLRHVALDLCVEAEALPGAGPWSVPCHAAFAASPAFAHGVDAESECGLPRRWWDEREHARQRAAEPLAAQAAQPRGPHARRLREGGAVLDLRRCAVPPRRRDAQPWAVASATRRSTRSLWALLAGRPAGAGLRRLRGCQDVAQAVADFVLENQEYEFEAEICFGLALANF